MTENGFPWISPTILVRQENALVSDSSTRGQ